MAALTAVRFHLFGRAAELMSWPADALAGLI
jgi:hypothetical protein